MSARRMAAVALMLGMAAAGCVDQGSESAEPAPICECAPGTQVVDPALLAFLSKAKSIHHQADLAESDGDPKRAVEVLESLVAGPAPAGKAPEVREVMADTLARIAELKSAAGDFEAAKRDIAKGLRLAPERTHYRGRLMEVLGVVEQRLHEHLLEEGDEEAAKAAKTRAIEALEEAVAIQDEVIRGVLGDAGP